MRDRVFSVGSLDDIESGERELFGVEMPELVLILHHEDERTIAIRSDAAGHPSQHACDYPITLSLQNLNR